MQYHPKLKKAMKEIKAILEREDIAASVVLHTPGFTEFLLRIDPTYSCASFDGEQLRIRAKLQEDFAGDKDAWNKKMTDTADMVVGLGNTSLNVGESFLRVKTMLRKNIEIESTDSGFTSHNTQNN